MNEGAGIGTPLYRAPPDWGVGGVCVKVLGRPGVPVVHDQEEGGPELGIPEAGRVPGH